MTQRLICEQGHRWEPAAARVKQLHDDPVLEPLRARPEFRHWLDQTYPLPKPDK